MRKTKIMAIAPYECTRDLLLQVARTRADAEISVFLGCSSKGVEQSQSMRGMGYSVILSQGETAEMIERAGSTPVVNIRVSDFDVLRSVRLAQNHSGPMAIAGSPEITNPAKALCELLQYGFAIYTVSSEEEAAECLHSLKSRGFTLVVGDMAIFNRARLLGLGSILAAPGIESVNSAVDEAVKLDRQMNLSNVNESLYRDILNGISQNVAVFHSSGDVVFSNLSRDGDSSLETLNLKKYVSDVMEKNSLNLALRKERSHWFVNASKLSHSDNDYAIFCLDKNFEKCDSDLYKILNCNEIIPDSIQLFFGSGDISSNPLMKATACGEYAKPALIRGEPGAGKESMAKVVHLNSVYRHSPMIILDGRFISDKKCGTLFGDKSQLMSVGGCTIYFKNVQCVPAEIQKKVAANFINTPLSKNNRLIFSHTDKSPFAVDNSFCEYLLGTLGCVSICIPPLRERREDIPSLASLYIGEANQKSTTQVLGFEKNAIGPILQYDWPTNTAQLKRVLNELLLLTRTSYIGEKDVISVLDNEKKFYSVSNLSVSANGTLDEIIKSAIMKTLTAENMNQTKAAARLGISRSTLWKRLKGE
jgi:transcriptional regulator with PAS, ATPase and Fis domain